LDSTEVGGEESDKEESLKGSLSPRKVGEEEGEKDSLRVTWIPLRFEEKKWTRKRVSKVA
jgi:hypothetical protein